MVVQIPRERISSLLSILRSQLFMRKEPPPALKDDSFIFLGYRGDAIFNSNTFLTSVQTLPLQENELQDLVDRIYHSQSSLYLTDLYARLTRLILSSIPPLHQIDEVQYLNQTEQWIQFEVKTKEMVCIS